MDGGGGGKAAGGRVDRSAAEEAFLLFDRSQAGVVDLDGFVLVARSLGVTAPSDALRTAFQANARENRVTLEGALAALEAVDDEDVALRSRLLQCFKALDEADTGSVRGEHLRTVLMTRGDCLKGEEVDEMFRAAGVPLDPLPEAIDLPTFTRIIG